MRAPARLRPRSATAGSCGCLRIALPLAAGGIFCAFALYVAAKWHLETGKFKVGGVEITADDLTMKDPTFFDVTSDGRYEVRAKRAVVAFSPRTPRSS